MTDLSPAAAAVLRAAGDSEPGIHATIAAALRALAVRIKGADAIRQDILDIAADLLAQRHPAPVPVLPANALPTPETKP